MAKDKRATDAPSKRKSSNPGRYSSETIQEDPELLAAIMSEVSGSEEFYWIMKLLSAELPLSNIEQIVARKVDEMKRLYARLIWIEPRRFSVLEWTINVIKSGIWKRRVECLLGEIVEFDTFREFIETPPPMGMGSSLEKLREICSGSEEALRLIDEVVDE
ncbi:MAG: hypothetical protein WBG50_15090 [Desulfomonilaceae bacterium]